MDLLFQPIDWYHCNIYRKRFFFMTELIAKAGLDINGNITLNVYTNSPEIVSSLLVIAIKSYEVILNYREKN